MDWDYFQMGEHISHFAFCIAHYSSEFHGTEFEMRNAQCEIHSLPKPRPTL